MANLRTAGAILLTVLAVVPPFLSMIPDDSNFGIFKKIERAKNIYSLPKFNSPGIILAAINLTSHR